MVRNAMSATEYYILNYLWSRETPGTFSEIMNYFNNEANKEWKKQTVNTFLTRLAQERFSELIVKAVNVRSIFRPLRSRNISRIMLSRSLTILMKVL